jgi:hypothetical protein
MLEVVIEKRRRTWEWRVFDSSGQIIMSGREKSRRAARYHSARALFLLLAYPKPRNEDAA